jgi:type II secretory pathway component PulM
VNWFNNLNSREQLIVALTAIVGIGAGAYLFIVEPLTKGIADRKISVQAQQNDLAWMQQQAALVKTSPSTGGARKPMDKAPYLLLDDAIRRARIKAPERVEPAGNQGAKAQFSEVEFDKLIRVLGELEQTYGLGVKTINVTKKSDGLVSARLSLEVEQ